MNHKQSYLTADAAHPLITHGSFKVEALLYHLDYDGMDQVANNFQVICSKELSPEIIISHLSGGEKVVLMVLIALFCPASHLRFIGIWHALDGEKRLAIQKLLDFSAKDIVCEDQP